MSYSEEYVKDLQERKRGRKRKIITTIITLPISELALFGVCWLFASVGHASVGAIIFSSLVALGIVAVYVRWIRPIKDYPEWFLQELDDLENSYNEKVEEQKEIDRKKEKEANDICPRCDTSGAVERVTDVNGSVGGNFNLGFGSVYGSTSTKPVNRCINPQCGHEWRKISYSYEESEGSVLSEMTNSLYYTCYPPGDEYPGIIRSIRTDDELKKYHAAVLEAFFAEKEKLSHTGEELSRLSVKDLIKYGCQP